ncbi:hypothetical protein BJ508DRAFT_13622 [Ascobolus immersus RN42]|uniref:Uncharacterized protein n=1 Tax=Ascobolus immersus RN42 TaxID=1160509 RepID=A0A3N4IG72_ASCIM|nr:hypothetical protein BJ508DRAFT_13622 [Ascobolus immersus RN42]
MARLRKNRRQQTGPSHYPPPSHKAAPHPTQNLPLVYRQNANQPPIQRFCKSQSQNIVRAGTDPRGGMTSWAKGNDVSGEDKSREFGRKEERMVR